MDSLALSIGLISSLNRADETNSRRVCHRYLDINCLRDRARPLPILADKVAVARHSRQLTDTYDAVGINDVDAGVKAHGGVTVAVVF